MGVEEIVERIRRDAAAEEERIRGEAAAEEERILRDGRAASEKEVAGIVAGGRQEAASLRRRVLARARLSARGRLRASREAGIDRTLEEAEQRIAALQHSDEYPTVLRKLILEGREVVGGGPITVLCRETDRGVVAIACSRMKGVAIAPIKGEEGEKDGGVVVLAGRARCDQRFSARITRMREDLNGRTAAILFGEGGHDHP